MRPRPGSAESVCCSVLARRPTSSRLGPLTTNCKRLAALAADHRIGRGEGARAGDLRQLLADHGDDVLLPDFAFAARRHAHHHHRLVDLPRIAEADQGEFGDDFLVAEQHFLDHAQAAVGVFDAGAERGSQVDQEAPFVLFGHESLADVDEEIAARHHRRQRQRHHLPAVAQRLVEQVAVEVVHAVKEAIQDVIHASVLLFHLEVARAQHRRQRERHEQRHQHAEGHHHREGFEELADDAAEENHRRENRDQGQRCGDHREHHFVAAIDRGGDRVGVDFLAVAEDVLQHHDGVVHHHADQQQQGEHGERIEGVAEEVDHRHRAHQRHRDGRGDDQGGAHAAQEQPDDQRGQQRAFDQMLLQGIDDFLDEDRVVGDDVQRHARRQLRDDLGFQAFLDRIDNRHGVGVGDLDDAQADGGLAHEARELPVIGQAVLDLGDILEAHRRAVAVGDDHFCQIVEAVEFQVELDQVFGLLPHQEAAGELDMLVGKGGVDILRGDLERGHSRRQQIDPDGAVAPSAQAHFAHAVDGFQALLDDVEGVLVELLLGAVAVQRQPHDRHGVGLDLGDDGRVGVLGQTAQHLVDLGLHLVEGDIDFLVQAEGDVDHRHAGRGGGLDVFDAGHAVDRGFESRW